MIATVDIKHPKVKDYSKEELEKLIEKVIYNYFEEEADGIDGEFYSMSYDELSEEGKRKFDLLDTMTDEEFEEKYFSI